MIQIIDSDIYSTSNEFLVNPVDCTDMVNTEMFQEIVDRCPHVYREYLRYIRYCSKSKINPLGTAQYIPVDSWALVMVDTIKNNRVDAYDKGYKYIVNLFGYKDLTDPTQPIRLKAIRNAFTDICEKANCINAAIAVPYGMFCKSDSDWQKLFEILKETADRTNAAVQIYRQDGS